MAQEMTDVALPALHEIGTDLTAPSRIRLATVLAIPFISVAAYFVLGLPSRWVLAVMAVMVLSFVSYGSSSHDLVHRALPIPRWLNTWLLSAMEMVCLRSGRAYQLTHLHHHRRFPNRDDVEASAAGGTLVGTLI